MTTHTRSWNEIKKEMDEIRRAIKEREIAFKAEAIPGITKPIQRPIEYLPLKADKPLKIGRHDYHINGQRCAPIPSHPV